MALHEFSTAGPIDRPQGVAKCIGKWYDGPCEYANSRAALLHLKLAQMGRTTSAAPSDDFLDTVNNTGRMKGNT